MPIYEYKCNKCGNKFEELQSISAPMPTCPKCSSCEIEKLVSAFGFKKGEESISSGNSSSCSSCSGGNCSTCR